MADYPKAKDALVENWEWIITFYDFPQRAMYTTKVLAIVINVAGSLVLVPLWGVFGVAWAVSMSLAL